MSNYYRRNADQDIRDLERRFNAGDITVLPRLVAYRTRHDMLTVGFLTRVPQAFHYMPEEIQQFFIAGGFRPPRRQLISSDDYCEPCLVPEHEACSMTEGCPCCEDTAHQIGVSLSQPAQPTFEEAQETGEIWECINCARDDLWVGNQDEEWVLLTEATADITNAHGMGGSAGEGICDECLGQAGIDLDEDIDAGLIAAQDAGEVWECISCSRSDLWEGNQNEVWALLTEASAAITEAKISRGSAGEAICGECAFGEAGLDLEEVVQEELEDYCMECGEMHDDCYCEEN
jgi:hypothetical protein